MQDGFRRHAKVRVAAQRKPFSCPGFVSNPQTARLRGTEVRANETVKKAAMRAQAKYGTLVPRDGRDGEALVALTTGDFTLSDLVFHRDADAPERSYNAASEPKDLRDMIEESNPVDAELFRRAREAMEDVMATPTFEARLGALLAMTNAASAFCDERKVCSSGRAVKDAIDFDFSHVSSLGEFPMSCGDAIATKEIKCVDDWFRGEGPDAEGSVWRSGRVHASAPSAPASPGGKNAAATGKEENSTAAAADETKTESSQRKTDGGRRRRREEDADEDIDSRGGRTIDAHRRRHHLQSSRGRAQPISLAVVLHRVHPSRRLDHVASCTRDRRRRRESGVVARTRRLHPSRARVHGERDRSRDEHER